MNVFSHFALFLQLQLTDPLPLLHAAFLLKSLKFFINLSRLGKHQTFTPIVALKYNSRMNISKKHEREESRFFSLLFSVSIAHQSSRKRSVWKFYCNKIGLVREDYSVPKFGQRFESVSTVWIFENNFSDEFHLNQSMTTYLKQNCKRKKIVLLVFTIDSNFRLQTNRTCRVTPKNN